MANKGIDDGSYLHQEIAWIKQDCAMIRNAVVLLEQEKDNLRQAVRKLKLENVRIKDKMKKMQTQLKGLDGRTYDSEEDELDYDDIGKDFILVGGAQDPLAIRYEVTIKDDEGVEHKSAERFYWYKMAEKFNDYRALERIRDAPNTPKAEEAMKEIQGFDEKIWNELKVGVWEKGQRFKLEQVKWISNLLVETGNTYIAVSHQDKMFGTGWRKNREESNKPIFWDGQNLGGKFLMKYRKKLMEHHVWAEPSEKEETHRKLVELKRFVWRRVDPTARRTGIVGSLGRGGKTLRGPGRGGSYNGNVAPLAHIAGERPYGAFNRK